MQQGHHLSKEERDSGLKNRVRVHTVEAKFWKIQRMEAISITQLLKGFCDDTNWKYVIFWKLDRHFPMTLTWENGYYCNTNMKSEDGVYSARPDSTDDSRYRLLMSEMSSLKYSLGEGVVGKIALSGNHCWVFCEDHLTSNLIPECPDEWLLQFAHGIKTIVLVPVIPQGVLQFGSFEVIVEDLRFVNKVKEKFHSFHYSAPMNTIMDSLDESSSITTWWNPTMPSFANDECYMSRENEMKTSHVEEEMWGNNVRLFGETSNGLGSYFGKSMTEQQFGGTETGRNDIENWNDFFAFPSESEFHVAPGSSFAKEVDPEYGLDDVLSNLYTASDDTSSISNRPITMPIHFTGSIRPNIMTNPYVHSNLMPNDFASQTSDGKSRLSIDEVQAEKVSSRIKKKAEVGNSRRTRPRDRQMIMDRMKELRELVPDGGRCSIHNLLEQTINHMLYLKKITSQAEKIKGSHPERSSRIDFQSELPWPIVIEDLEILGHMRIEMRCNEHGLFLEIAQVIRKMELTILKGVLEDNSTSAWARFIVEVPRGFHRMDVLCPLLHLLQLRTNPVI